MRRKAPIRQIFLLFLRRLRLPAALFVLFHLVVLTVYMGVEGVTWDDALFWITHPHGIHPEHVTTSTKIFATIVFTGVKDLWRGRCGERHLFVRSFSSS